MDIGKRPMTAAQVRAEEKAKKSAYRLANTTLHSISHSQGPTPPIPVEPESVGNIVGTQVYSLLQGKRDVETLILIPQPAGGED